MTSTSLALSSEFLIVQCDKNLGPAIIERSEYIRLGFHDHLNNTAAYRRLTPLSAKFAEGSLRLALEAWIKRHKQALPPSELKYLRHHLRNNKDPFPAFYLTMKVHKTPLKTRPIVSCSGSLLEGLGRWVDSKLQSIARRQRSYFPSSYHLKQELLGLDPLDGAKLFTADAVSMYTNIPTREGLESIASYLRQDCDDYSNIVMDALIEGLRLVMKNNVFTFGDTTWKQVSGTAMGTPPAPPYATLYYAIHEEAFLDEFPDNLIFYRRFIDDVFGIWCPSEDATTDSIAWSNFQRRMNDCAGLTWEISPRSEIVDFMDLTIRLDLGQITTTLFEKKLNLHLYIPPHSSHPPGLLTGIVFGNLFRIQTLCSNDEDRHQKTNIFFHRLRARGYQRDKLLPIFQKAIERAKTYTGPTMDDTNSRSLEASPSQVFFHLQFHPSDPPSTTIQRAWRNCILEPPSQATPLPSICNFTGHPTNISRLIVAYSRPHNLGNMLSYRKLRPDHGPPVSSFEITN